MTNIGKRIRNHPKPNRQVSVTKTSEAVTTRRTVSQRVTSEKHQVRPAKPRRLTRASLLATAPKKSGDPTLSVSTEMTRRRQSADLVGQRRKTASQQLQFRTMRVRRLLQSKR